MKKLLHWFDPYEQSFLFFRCGIVGFIIILAISFWLTLNWKNFLPEIIMDNIFVYLPNYLTHEMLGHNLVGIVLYRIGTIFSPACGEWFMFFSGNATETFLPLFIFLLLLNIEGGRWAIPPVLYWLGTTLYGAGVYAADARACSLPLTSSDMMTNYKPGEICGDWRHILEPLNLLSYDQWIAYTFLFLGFLCFVLAVYSIYYYWNHTEQYLRRSPRPTPKQDDWQPPNIYTPQ